MLFLFFNLKTKNKNRLKAKYAKLRGLAGVAIYSLNDDDPTNKCELEGAFALTRSTIIGLNGLDDGSRNLEHHHLTAQSSNSVWKIDGVSDFSDVLERYGNIERIVEQEEGEPESLPCDKPGYRLHPRDCTHFYRCVKLNSSSSASSESNGALLRFKYKCGTGLVFDERLAMCNHPSWSNRCANSGEIEQLDGHFCRSANTFYQKANDCGYFYYCNEKRHAFQFKCPFELGFDEHTLNCNWKWLVAGCNVAAPNLTSQNNIKDLFNSNLIKSQPDQLNSYLNIDSPENSLNLNAKDFESKRTNVDTESIELDKLASELHLTRQRRSTESAIPESPSIAKSIKNKMSGLIGSVKSLLGSSESKEKLDLGPRLTDLKADSSRRQDNMFSDWLNLPFLYNQPSQVVQTSFHHLPVSTYSLSSGSLNSRPILTNRIPLPKNLQPMLTSPMLTSANVQSYTKLSPPPVILNEYRVNQNMNSNSNLQNMVNSHSMHHHSMQMRQPFIENDKMSILIPHGSSTPKLNNKPINNLILNNGQLTGDYKLVTNGKSKNLKNNYKEKRIQRRPDIQLSELVKQELNKFRLNNKPQYNSNPNKMKNDQHYKLDAYVDEVNEKTKPQRDNLHSNGGHFQTSNSALKPNVVHYHFEPLTNGGGDVHHLDDNHQLHYHHHQHHSQSMPSNSAMIDNYIQVNHLKDEHVHIPFTSNQQVNPITVKPANNNNNHKNNYDPLLSSDLFKDYSIDIRPIHLKSHSKLNNQQPIHKQAINHKQNGFVPMKATTSNKKQSSTKPPTTTSNQLLQSSSKNDYHVDNRKQSSSNQTNLRSKNRVVDEFVFVEDKRKLAGSNKNTNLLIIPVPDHHPKAQSLEEIQRLIQYYPEFFPDNFNVNSKVSHVNASLEQLLAHKSPNTDYFVVTVDEKNQNSTKPIIRLEEYLKYETPVDDIRRHKSKKLSKQQTTVLPVIVTNSVYSGNQLSSSKPTQSRKSNKNKSQLKQATHQSKHTFIPEIPSTPIINTATSKAPVVIKLEIPHGKP